MMKNKKSFVWIIGTVAATLAGLLMTLVYHAITWGPTLIEIASVTWNDGPNG